ncbi:hypothetical protein SAMN05660284_01339 [Formivibrio citricus]|uniref:Uncharacterized protein n=1 Tax=Formivibrio citricus TaxID=83765 RepID=A0A1I4YIZ6_9NEIS|nr:hypothetical protein SAMN05660284_01339 [Formivibrio citricus]
MPVSRKKSSPLRDMPQGPLAQSEVDAQLLATKPQVASEVQEGDKLFLALYRLQQDLAVVALHNGLVVGELTCAQLQLLRNHIEQGVVFTACVTRKIGELIKLRVKPTDIDNKRPHRLLYRYTKIHEPVLRSRIFGLRRSGDGVEAACSEPS